MTDPSELQRSLASAADLAKRTSILITQLLGDLSNLKGQLDTIHPIFSAVHKKMTEGEPALLTPVEPEPAPEEPQTISDEPEQDNPGS